MAAGLLIATAFLTEPALAIARRRRAARPAVGDAHIVLADYERLVVTHSRQDGTVYVLRPPDADPQAILLAARLVLAQDRYEAARRPPRSPRSLAQRVIGCRSAGGRPAGRPGPARTPTASAASCSRPSGDSSRKRRAQP